MRYGGLLSVRNRCVSILNSNPLWGPLWGPRCNLFVPVGMTGTVIIAILNLYGPGLQRTFRTAPIPGGLPFAFALGILIADDCENLPKCELIILSDKHEANPTTTVYRCEDCLVRYGNDGNYNVALVRFVDGYIIRKGLLPVDCS
jgi:hypothetical protein